MTQYAHKGQILPLANQMIPIDKQTTFHASYDYHLNGYNQGDLVPPNGPERGTRFSGGSKATAPALFSTAPSAVTIEGWVNLEVAAAYPTIIDFGSPGTAFYIEQNNTNILFGAYVGSGGAAFSGASQEIQGAITYNTWTHFAMTVTSSQMMAYINGVQVGSTATGTFNFSPLVNNGPSMGAGRGNLQGTLSDVRVWNFAKTPNQIQLQMYAKLHGDESGLVANWKLRETEGIRVSDSSMNAFDAVISGTAGRNLTGNVVATIKNNKGKFNGAVIIEPDTTNAFPYPMTQQYAGGNLSAAQSYYVISGYRVTAVNQPLNSPLPGCSLSIGSGLTFTVSGYTNLSSVKIYHQGFDSSNNTVYTQIMVSATPDTTGFFSSTINVGTQTNLSYVNLGIGNDTVANYYIEKVQVEKRDYPTSFVNGSRPLGKLWYPNSLITPSAFTISCWFNIPWMHRNDVNPPNTGIQGNWFHPIIEIATPTNSSQSFGIVAGPQPASWNRNLQLQVPGGVTVGYAIQDNTWYHLVATYNGSAYNVYINGTQEISYSSTTPIAPASAEVLMVGGGYRGKAFCLIDELRIQSRAISTDEISAWASSGLHYNYLDYSYYVD